MRTFLIFLNIALLAFLTGFLVMVQVVKADAAPTPTTYQAFTFDDVTGPANVTYVEGDTLPCGSADYALGCWDGGKDVRILADLTPPLAAWVLAHETAHAYGATECDADRYAYHVTGNSVMFHMASTYAKGCGHYDAEAAFKAL